ncbi:MAG: PD-(D/E)XK nuclease family protein [Rikenellaceae bacterium]|nr:PD-(D/E)XK nuclease family protein [Rikenellaceae bacterium]
MQTFLGEVARTLYGQYGDEIQNLKIIFPSRRSRIFFNNELSRIVGKPIFQPDYLSVDDLMEQIAGISKSESVRLLAELYKSYSKYHEESFDSFYCWGEMLLADFDTIDKYLIDARTLFINIADLKDMEQNLSYLTEDQIEIIKRFWNNFDPEDMSSPEKRSFTDIWNSLFDIYTDFRERIIGQGMAYPGLIYRSAAEKVMSGMVPENITTSGYAVVGFNALTECEKKVFDYLRNTGSAGFFWDYDIYYTGNREQESGLFLRENIKRYPSLMSDGFDNFSKPKNITVVSAPSDVMQAKYTSDFIRKILDQGQVPDKETAVILTDENLLFPVLHSVPESVTNVNVTMGYPLKSTPAYTFLEKLIGLQQRKKKTELSCVFYHNDVKGILNHPYLNAASNDYAENKYSEVQRRQQIYISENFLKEENILAGKIFTGITGWESICDYFTDIFNSLFDNYPHDNDGNYPEKDFLMIVSDHIVGLKNSLKGCGITISDAVLLSLLRKSLSSVRIPFEGEPLKGIQVMGILETRNLDFKNILLLSVNDDTFPGNLSTYSSFIPYNLRLAYGLPTPQHHEGVFGYYFYRVLQRAENVFIAYSSKSDEKKTGEPSRYIYQLDYESPHKIHYENISLNVNIRTNQDNPIEKNEEIQRLLNEFTGKDALRSLSPSAFYGYIECPVKFYYQTLCRITEDIYISEEIDLPMFGNILHKAAEVIYGSIKNDPAGARMLRGKFRLAEIENIVDKAVCQEYFRENYSSGDFGGNVALVRDIVVKYLSRCVLKYDNANPDFTVRETEYWISSFIELEGQEVKLGGKVDRLDELHDGRFRIVDYKTGRNKPDFKEIGFLFSGTLSERNPAALQTLIYSYMVHREFGKEVVPSLYFVRNMNDPGFSPLLNEASSGEIYEYSKVKRILEENFKNKLSELFDPSIPFMKSEDKRTCEYCAFKDICR